MENRSLTNETLKVILEKNLQRDFATWPAVDWDADMLTVAALYYQPSLEIARAQWAIAQGGEKTAGQSPNPTLTATPTYNFTTFLPSPWDPVGIIDIPIETAGKRGYRRAQAAHLADAARLNITSTAWHVRNAVRSALIELIAAGQRQESLALQVKIQNEILHRQAQQVDLGEIAPPDLLAVRVGFQKTQLDLAESQRLVVEARARLAGAIGVSLHALSRIKLSTAWPENAAAIAELTTRKVQRAALRTRPDILSALAEYAASQSALQLEIARQYPDIHLQPGYEFDQGDSKWSLGFSVELPVLNQNQGPIAEARARREESAARFNALQTRVMVEIEGAIESFRIAETNYSALRGLAEVQQNRRDLVAAQVKSGAADQLDLLSAQLEFATAQLVQIDGEIRLQQAAASLEDAVQRPLAFSHEILFSSRGNAR